MLILCSSQWPAATMTTVSPHCRARHMLGDSWGWCLPYPMLLLWPRHRSGGQSCIHACTTHELTSLCSRSMTWRAGIFTSCTLTKWFDDLVFLWIFCQWTGMRCPQPPCVPLPSEQHASVPGISCRIQTRCLNSETYRRFTLSWKQSWHSCSKKMGHLVTGARKG